MGRVLTVCALLMAVVLGVCSQLDPQASIMWFAATNGHLALERWITFGLLAVLLIADAYADNPIVRRIAAGVSLIFAYEATRIIIDHSVYMLDFLLVALSSVCFAIVALQSQGEMRELPALPKSMEHGAELSTVPMYITMATLFDRLRRLSVHQQVRRLNRTSYISDIKDDSHRLTVSMQGRGGLAFR